MKKILIPLLFITASLFSQNNDKVTLYDKDYNKIKQVDINDSLETADSLYNTNNKFYNAFYLVTEKDTLFIRRREQSIKVYKAGNKDQI